MCCGRESGTTSTPASLEWISGETFLLNDGLYARALVAYEDWLVGRQSAWVSMGGGFISAGAARNQDGRLEIVAAHAERYFAPHLGDRPGSAACRLASDGRVRRYAIRHPEPGRPHGAVRTRRRRCAAAPLADRSQRPVRPLALLEGSVIGQPTVARNADGRMELFAAFADGTVHHRWQVAPNGPFDAWHSLEGIGSQPKVAANLDGRLELFVIGPDNRIHHRWQTAPNAFFDSWRTLDGTVRHLSIARNQDGRLELFAITPDQKVVHRWQTGPNQPFDGWHAIGERSTAIESVALARDASNCSRSAPTAVCGGTYRPSRTDRSSAGNRSEHRPGRTGRRSTLAAAPSCLRVRRTTSRWFMRQPAIGTWLRPA